LTTSHSQRLNSGKPLGTGCCEWLWSIATWANAFQIFPCEILEIRKLGQGKVLVQLNSYESANRLVNNNSLAASNLKAFISSYRVLHSSIVRDVPQDVSLELLKDSISSPIKILEIHCLNHRLKSDNMCLLVPSVLNSRANLSHALFTFSIASCLPVYSKNQNLLRLLQGRPPKQGLQEPCQRYSLRWPST